MRTRFGLTALILTLAAGCEEEAKASTSADGGSTYDDSAVLARLDALEASVAALQVTADANTDAIAAIDIEVLSYRVDEIEGELDLLQDGMDLSEITAQIESNTVAIEALSAAEYLTAEDLPAAPDLSGYLTSADLPDLSGYLTAADLPAAPDLSEFLTADDLPAAPDLSEFLTADDLPPETDLSGVETRLDAVETLSTANGDSITTHTGQIAGNTTFIDNNRSSIETITTRVESNQTDIVALGGEIGAIDLSVYLTASDLPDLSPILADISTNAADVATATSNIDNLWVYVADLEDAVDDIDAVPGLADYVSVDGTTNTVLFSGANVQVVSGAGSAVTDTTLNGLGNLIIGYNSGRFSWSEAETAANRTGAHNLVMGQGNAYTNHYGIVHGFWNEAHARYAVAIGGQRNDNYGEGAVTIGGRSNYVLGEGAVTVSGRFNEIYSEESAAIGGVYADVSGQFAATVGGSNTECPFDDAACMEDAWVQNLLVY